MKHTSISVRFLGIIFALSFFGLSISLAAEKDLENLIFNGNFEKQKESWQLQLKGSEVNFVELDHPKYKTGLRIQPIEEEETNPWDIHLVQILQKSFVPGQNVVVKFWARSGKGGRFFMSLEDPFHYQTHITDGMVKAVTEWQEYTFEGVVPTTIQSDKLQLAFHFSYPKNSVIEITGIRVFKK